MACSMKQLSFLYGILPALLYAPYVVESQQTLLRSRETNIESTLHSRALGCKPRDFHTFSDIDSVEPIDVLSFYAMGDFPYTIEDRYCLNQELRDLDLTVPGGPSMIVHVGDIKKASKTYPCDAEAYNDIAEIFTNPANALRYDPRDVVFVPGDGEWIKCPDDDAAWELWKTTLGPLNPYGFATFSEPNVEVTRQWDEERKPGVDRSENAAVYRQNVLTIFTNIIGGKDYGDESVRLVQNFNFTKEQMELHEPQGMKAVVIFGHAFLKPGVRREFYGDYLVELLNTKYPTLPVLYVHGDGHEHCVRYPYESNPYFAALMVDEGMFAPPVLVKVVKHPETDEHIFQFDRRGGLYNGACPQIQEKTWQSPGDPPQSPLLPGPVSNPAPVPDPVHAPAPVPDPVPAPAPVPDTVPDVPPDIDADSFSGQDTTDQTALKKLTLYRIVKNHIPLETCEGDCDSDSDCLPGLMCHKRLKKENILGCLPGGVATKDYCYNPLFPNPPPYGPEHGGAMLRPGDPTSGGTETDSSGGGPPEGAPQPEPSDGGESSEAVEEPPQDNESESVAVNDTTSAPKELFWISGRKKAADFKPHPECGGDCDDDSHCEGDLVCFERKRIEKVPGCEGTGRKGKDYCFNRVPNVLMKIGNNRKPARFFPLRKCEADCDVDSECGEGLVCNKKKKEVSVPGCEGVRELGSDYCYDPSDETTPDASA